MATQRSTDKSMSWRGCAGAGGAITGQQDSTKHNTGSQVRRERRTGLTRDRGAAGAKPLVADGRRACCSAHPCRAEGGAAPPAGGGEGPPLARLGAPVTKTEARVKLFSPAITLLAPQMLARYYPAFPAPQRSAGPPPRRVVTPPDDRRPPCCGSHPANQSEER